MKKTLKHPLSGAVYEGEAGGLVRVEQDGRVGYYSVAGEWQSGAVLDVCPHMCGWLAGTRVDAAYDKPYKSV